MLADGARGELVKFTLPGLPPSLNHSHFARGRRLKPETKAWMDAAGLMMLGQRRGQSALDASRYGLTLELRLFGKWRTKAGKIRRVDLSNRIKIVEDLVAKVCGFDDSEVTCIRAMKIEAPDQRTEVDVFDDGLRGERAA